MRFLLCQQAKKLSNFKGLRPLDTHKTRAVENHVETLEIPIPSYGCFCNFFAHLDHQHHRPE